MADYSGVSDYGQKAITSEWVGGGAGAAKGVMGGVSGLLQGQYQSRISGINAQLMQLQAADVERRGQLAASQQLVKGNQIAGGQRVAFAASGVDVNSGSAARVQAATKAMSEIDAVTIENNAHLQAIGYNMEAINQQAASKMAGIAGMNNLVQGVAAGGMGLAAAGIRSGMLADRYKLRVPVDEGPTTTASASPAGEEVSNDPELGESVHFFNPEG